MPPLEHYSRQLNYSYALGLYPAIQALEKAPQRVSRVLVHNLLEPGEGAQALFALCEEHGIRTETADRVLRKVSGKDNCYAAAVVQKENQELQLGRNHLVLVNPMDAGNLGTLLRTALGLGYFDIALITPCADPYEPQTVRASMGALFSLRVREYADINEYLKDAGERSLYPFMLSDSALSLQCAVQEKKAPFSLVFGNEGTGLPAVFAALGQAVKIEQSDEVDSLNLAIAAAIGMYSFKETY